MGGKTKQSKNKAHMTRTKANVKVRTVTEPTVIARGAKHTIARGAAKAAKTNHGVVRQTTNHQANVSKNQTANKTKNANENNNGNRTKRPAYRNTKTANVDETFAQGLCFQKLFFIFLIGSVLGTIYEDVLIYFRTLVETGTGVWMTHRGVIYGPFNVIYGFGAVLMCWILLRRKYKNWQMFGIAALLGGTVEYMLSFLQETFTGTISWDYSDLWLNLNGRTTIPIMLVWGAMGLVLVKVVYPFISNLIEKIPVRFGVPIFWILLVFMILNCVISWTAIIRQNLRHQKVQPFTPVGEFYDEYYNDDYLRNYFPNMVRSSEK